MPGTIQATRNTRANKTAKSLTSGARPYWKGSHIVLSCLCLLKRYAEVLTQVPVNVTFHENKVFADVIKLSWGHAGWGGGTTSNDWSPIRRGKPGHRHRERRTSGEDTETEGRGQRSEWPQLPSQGTLPRIASSRQKLEQARKSPPLQPLQGAGLLTPWLQAPGLQNCERRDLCCLNHPVCGNLLQIPRKLIHSA